MAIVNLTNQTTVEGQYGSPASAISFFSNEVTTNIVQGLMVQKNADKTNWVNGPLTYTIVVTNNSGNTLSSGSLIDKIDTTLVDFSTTYGVQIDDSKTSNYTYNDGNLQVTLPDLETDKSVTITFQVTQK